MMTFKEFLIGCYTDAAGRPEIKTVLGTLSALTSLVYICATREVAGFVAINTLTGILIGTVAVADDRLDKRGSDAVKAGVL
jgi:hypothetical protein